MTQQIEISNLLTPFINGFNKLSNELKDMLDIGLTDYLHSQTEKYYFTNTFIHRGEKVKFKEIYYPIKATYKNLSTDFDNIFDVFEEYKKITIVGSAGSGKSTLIKNIFLNAIDKNFRIPIIIELRNLNDYNGDLEKLIFEKVLKSKIKSDSSIFKRALNSGKFLFLLDGYDEIFSIKKQEINRQIDLFVDSYPENYYVISTRPGSGIENFSRFYDFNVCGLTNNDVSGFISRIVDNEERKKSINDIIFTQENKNYLEFLRNPLLLSMFILAFENHPEIPKRKSAFYRNVFDTLYSKHDGISKNSFLREKLTKLQRDDFEELLASFSYLTLIEGKYSFTYEFLSDILKKISELSDIQFEVENLIYDLHTSISIIILEGFEYLFPHRSIQEYFAAVFTSKLPNDKKIKAYYNLSDALETSSTDYSYNYWSLCIELDEVPFISHFMLKNLKIIYEELEKVEGIILITEFFKIINPVIITDNFDNESFEEVRILRHRSFKNSILDFCVKYDYSTILRFPKHVGIESELKKLKLNLE